MKKFLSYFSLAVIIAIFGFVGLNNVASAHNTDKLTVCHKTHSETNPWVEQEINANELQSHLANGDFLVNADHKCPPVTPTPTPKLCEHWGWNWDEKCVTPTPTVSVTPTPSPTPCDGEDCVTPTPTPTEEITPTPTPSNTGGGSDGGSSNPGATQAPVCSDGTTTQLPANVFVNRNGTQATVNFFITEGDSANIYYKVDGHSSWEFSVPNVTRNSDKFVSYTITGLDANTAYDFAVQQKQGCGGG